MVEIIAISNQKGGVGKTTSAVNLAASLAVLEKKVLVIDLDPQANTSSGLGLTQNSGQKTVYHCIAGEESLQGVIKRTELPFLDLIPASQDLLGAEIELVTMQGRESKLKSLLAPIANDYDYIFIDCPPALGLLTVNALTAAKKVIIPLQTEYYAMEGLSQLLRTVQLVKKSINQEISVKGILLTMVDHRNNLSKQVENDIRYHFGELVFCTTIPRNVKLSEAPSHGMPAILYDISSKGSQAYMSLANELIN